MFTLKKVRKTYELLKATKLKARNVEKPPLKTAVPLIINSKLLIINRKKTINKY